MTKQRVASQPGARGGDRAAGRVDGDAKQPPRVGKPLIGCMLVIIYNFAARAMNAPYNSCVTDNVPLVQQVPGFVSDSERATLLSGVLALRNSDNLLSSQFSASKGFVLRFNEEGLAQLAGSTTYSFLGPLVERMREPLANAFVLNAVIMPLSTINAPDKPMIGLHFDDTVGIDSASRFLAHTVTVLYLAVPDGMSGGELHLFDYERRGWLLRESGTPDAIVTPVEGHLTSFRGDSLHRVTEAALNQSASEEAEQGTARVSLVLEQYRIPPAHYAQTLTFEVTANGVDIRSYGNIWKSGFVQLVQMACKGAIALLLCWSWLAGAWERVAGARNGANSAAAAPGGNTGAKATKAA